MIAQAIPPVLADDRPATRSASSSRASASTPPASTSARTRAGSPSRSAEHPRGPRRRRGLRRQATRRRAVVSSSGCSPTTPPAPSKLAEAAASETSAETWRLFRLLARAQGIYGRESLGPFIISMTRGPADLLTVLLLARWAGCAPGLAIVPLFETLDDLDAAPACPRRALRAARLPRAPRAMRRRADGDDRLFRQQQGRRLPRGQLGAVPGAGVDRAHAARLTASRSRSSTVEAGQRGARRRPGQPRDSRPAARHRARPLPRDRAGRDHRLAVRRSRPRAPSPGADRERGAPGVSVAGAPPTLRPPGARRWTRWRRPRAMPIAGWSKGPRASSTTGAPRRPSTRSAGSGSARVPRPAAAAPSRGARSAPSPGSSRGCRAASTCPGWYGLGAALAAGRARSACGRCTRAGRSSAPSSTTPRCRSSRPTWASPRSTPSSCRTARSPPPSLPASRTSTRGRARPSSRRRATPELMDGDPVIQRSVQLRNPYVDPLNYLQVEMLRRLRALSDPDGPEAERHREVIVLTINGIAGGLRNTG